MIYDELYQEIILDHYKMPRNFFVMEDSHCHKNGYNPLCGDNFTIYLKIDNKIISDISFQGQGCAISTASTSMMTDLLKGKTLSEAKKLCQLFHNMLTKDCDEDDENLDELIAMKGVRKFSMRVKCATLSWHALSQAIDECERT